MEASNNSEKGGKRDYIPLFTCKHHWSKNDTAIQFCVWEKVIVVFNFLLSLFLFYQAFFVYMRQQKIPASDGRVRILFFCLASSLYTFFHYGILYPKDKGYQFFIIIMFRFTIIFMVCFYYCDKATGILRFRKQLMKFLKLFAAISILSILAMGILLTFDLAQGKYATNLHCKDPKFQTYRIYSFVTSIIFFVVNLRIKKYVLEHPGDTVLDQKVQKHQLRQVARLNKVSIWFICITGLSVLSDNLASWAGESTCTDRLFPDSVKWLNPLWWFITRFL